MVYGSQIVLIHSLEVRAILISFFKVASMTKIGRGTQENHRECGDDEHGDS
jgi:hypothetical protein